MQRDHAFAASARSVPRCRVATGRRSGAQSTRFDAALRRSVHDARFRRAHDRPSVAADARPRHHFAIAGLDAAARHRRGRHPRRPADVHDRRARRPRRARGARARPRGDPQLGLRVPARRITVNLAPAHLRKAGPGFDLALAVGVLAASGQVPAERARARSRSSASSSLGGELRAGRGALAVAEGAARAAGSTRLVVPARARRRGGARRRARGRRRGHARARSAEVLRGERAGAAAARAGTPAPAAAAEHADLADVRGHAGADRRARRSPPPAATTCCWPGRPGTGKTMLARRLPSILPPLTRAEALEVTRIHSVAGAALRRAASCRERPFRAPHHTISAAGPGRRRRARRRRARRASPTTACCSSTSSRSSPRPRSRRCASRSRTAASSIVRGQRARVFPTRFMLVAATNPCPCGYAGTRRGAAAPTPISPATGAGSAARCSTASTCSSTSQRPAADELAGRRRDVVGAVARAGRAPRASASGGASPGTRRRCNARDDAGAGARATCALDAREAQRCCATPTTRGSLSARGHHRVLRVARTIADLDGPRRGRARARRGRRSAARQRRARRCRA